MSELESGENVGRRVRVSDLSEVILRGSLSARRAPALEQERESARYDLLRGAHFRPCGSEGKDEGGSEGKGEGEDEGGGSGFPGPPYCLTLTSEGDKLRLELYPPVGMDTGRGVGARGQEGSGMLASASLAFALLRGTMRDYSLLCESYFEAVRTSSAQRIEAIDMARRSLHDEGGEMIREALGDIFTLDRETGRLFFSLLYALRPRALSGELAGERAAESGESLSSRLVAVAFVCNSNAIRSPMAADLARATLGHGVAIFSAAAGVARAEVDGFVVRVMMESGHSLAHWRPQALEEIEPQLRGLGSGVVVVALSRGAEGAVEDLAGRLGASWQGWRIMDPSQSEGTQLQRLEATRSARDAIGERIAGSLAPLLGEGA
ncbi:MAG: UPF0262 family protein [Alphaproteobacteria bacterium]